MYNINNRYEAIKDVQNMLKINGTGKYDNNMQKEVLEHQKSNCLEITGNVDYETFASIHRQHLHEEAIARSELNVISAPSFPYKFGDFGADVAFMNSLINEILKEYTVSFRLPTRDYYGRDTENAVAELRKIFKLQESLEIDHTLFDRMITEKNVISVKNKQK